MNDKTVIVTGASQGSGRAIAEAFLEASYTVVGWSRRRPEWGAEYGARFIPFSCDVSVEAEVERTFAAAEEAVGAPIRVLVNNAGISSASPIQTDTLAHWNQEFAVNATGVFLCTRHVVRRLVECGLPGRIINISSIAGRSAFPNLSAYSASKAAVIGFTRSLAVELGRHDITVNAICPGSVETEMFRDVLKRLAAESGKTLETITREQTSVIPLCRFQQPEDVAALALFLASDGARNISGEAINLDGGVVRC